VYGPGELRRLTRELELGRRVALQVERDGRLLELAVENGPLGAQLGSVRTVPRVLPPR